jgi:hypothetical protein
MCAAPAEPAFSTGKNIIEKNNLDLLLSKIKIRPAFCVNAFSQINGRRIYALNQVMIDSVRMDTKELGAILQPNLHNKYQTILSDVDIRFEEAVEDH